MNAPAEKALKFAAFVLPNSDGWSVTCSCGYLVTGWPNQQLAQSDMDNHIARCHTEVDE